MARDPTLDDEPPAEPEPVPPAEPQTSAGEQEVPPLPPDDDLRADPER